MMCKDVIQNNPQLCKSFAFTELAMDGILQEAGKGTWEGG